MNGKERRVDNVQICQLRRAESLPHSSPPPPHASQLPFHLNQKLNDLLHFSSISLY